MPDMKPFSGYEILPLEVYVKWSGSWATVTFGDNSRRYNYDTIRYRPREEIEEISVLNVIWKDFTQKRYDINPEVVEDSKRVLNSIEQYMYLKPNEYKRRVHREEPPEVLFYESEFQSEY